MLLELVEIRMNDFIGLMKNQLGPWTPSSIKNESREYAQHLVMWLEENAKIWAPLPPEMQSSLQFRALHKISHSMVVCTLYNYFITFD